MPGFNKIAAILFIAVYTLSTPATSEFLKLPVLAAHFYDHRKENNLSLTSFLFLHYVIEDNTDSDADEDRKLPFKSGEQIALLSFISLTPPVVVTGLIKSYTKNNNAFIIRDDFFISSQYLAAIWQPPRSC